MSSPDLLPLGEIEFRYARCRRLLRTLAPDAGGMLVTSRLGIYYLTGTLGWGLVWLPVEGEPVLLLRKGVERAQLESPLRHILPFKSYREITSLCAGCGSPLSSAIAVDKNGFNWSMAEMLQSRMEGVRFTSCDAVLAQARAVKSEWELEKLRRCGALHAKVLDEMLPERIHPGMSEFDVARTYVEAVFACGGSGMLRMNAPGEENFFGYASADTSAFIPPITMDLLVAKACVRPFRLWEMPNAFGRSAPCFPSIWGSMLKGIIRIGHRCTGVARPIRSPARFVGHMPCALRFLNKPQPR